MELSVLRASAPFLNTFMFRSSNTERSAQEQGFLQKMGIDIPNLPLIKQHWGVVLGL